MNTETKTVCETPVVSSSVLTQIDQCGFPRGVTTIVAGYLAPCVKTWFDNSSFNWSGPMCRGQVNDVGYVECALNQQTGWVCNGLDGDWSAEAAQRRDRLGTPNLIAFKGTLAQLSGGLRGGQKSSISPIAEMSVAEAARRITFRYMHLCGLPTLDQEVLRCILRPVRPPDMIWFLVVTDVMAVRADARDAMATEVDVVARVFESCQMRVHWAVARAFLSVTFDTM